MFGGYAGRRSLFRGTIYSVRNAKIVQMAIGSLGIQKMVKIGAKITICATVPLTILECILKDQFTVANVVGRVAADLIKVSISAILGGLAGLIVGSLTTVAALPIIATIVICLGSSKALDNIDNQYNLTNKLVAAMEQSWQALVHKKGEIEEKLGRGLYEMEREFIYRAYGYDIAKPPSLQNRY